MKTGSPLRVEISDPEAGCILVVDDDTRNLKLLDAILTAEGHHPIMAQSGNEALKLAAEASPDLILLDIMLPGIDGYGILRKLRAAPETMNVPVVMVTSLHDQDSKVRAMDEGADDFLTKPVSRLELVARVRSLLKVKAYYDNVRDQKQILEHEVERKTEILRHNSKQLEVLNQASYMINSVLDISKILRATILAALELWESEGGAAAVVEDGELRFREWHWKGERFTGDFQCNILQELKCMSSFMEPIKCSDKKCHKSCPFSNSADNIISDRIAIPIYDRQMRVQACILLLNPRKCYPEERVIDNPLPGLISITSTALDNARNVLELKDKEEALHASLREKDLLIKEIHHRVKNNLQAIVGLLEAHLGAVENPRDREIFQKGQGLAMSMSMIHELLYSTQDYTRVEFGKYTEKLVSHALNLYPDISTRIQVHYDLDQIYLNTDTAVPVSLIINEILTNALIHAFPGGRSGKIFISMKMIGSGGFMLEIIDDGIGISDPKDMSGPPTLGMNLVRSLMENLHGTMEVKIDGGTRYTLRFKEYFECENLALG